MNTKYTVKLWRVLTDGFTIIIPFSLILYYLITTNTDTSLGLGLFLLILILPFACLIAYLLNRYLACAKQVLEFSEDGDTFYFGDNSTLNKYSRKEIEKITIYQPGGGGAGNGKLHYFYAYEILFKDGTIIKFSSMLISEADVLDNFQNDLIRYGVGKSPFWKL